MRRRTDVEVYVLKWTDDAPTDPGEESNATINTRLFINGMEIEVEGENGVKVNTSMDITTVDATLLPTSVKVLGLDKEEWDAL